MEKRTQVAILRAAECSQRVWLISSGQDWIGSFQKEAAGRMYEKMNLLGAITALSLYASAILVFLFRLLDRSQYGHWIGYFEFLLAAPLIILFLTAPQLRRPVLYYVQVGCMLAWLIVEALLDYRLKIDFRNVRWMVISYVVLFFAGTGGMLGVATNAGRYWSISCIILFLVMTVLTFLQRAVTGM
jgi:hypothetical protein